MKEEQKIEIIGHRNIATQTEGDVYIGGSFIPIPTIPVNGCNLPNRHPNFVGRQDEIRKVINALTSRAWIIAIDGMGGIGKTTLALEVAHLCKERNPDYPQIPKFTGYIWISARDKSNFCLDDVVREILYTLSPFETSNKQLGRDEQLSLAIRALAAEPCLLIIDNFESVKDEPLHRFLRDNLPDPSKVLITSRHHIQTGETVVTIGGLEENDAVQLLRLEAIRLQIPIDDKDTSRLQIIARKSYGIPLVLRWVMESVYNGKSLEWTLESLEHATAEDIFDYIFERSLPVLDSETRCIFRSMSLFPTWTRIETISAINPGIAAIQERVGHLVAVRLIDDNRNLVQSNRRYQLHPLTRYLAVKELTATEDRGISVIEYALQYYLKVLSKNSYAGKKYLEEEFINIDNIVRSAIEHFPLLEQCIQVAEIVGNIDYQKGRILFSQLIDPINKIDNLNLSLKLLNSIDNPYNLGGTPVRSPMFFGRKELLEYIQESFESDQPHTSVISLIGQRRIGKTSILLQLFHEVSPKCVYVLINLQVVADSTAHLLYNIVHRINDVLIRRGIATNQPTLEDFAQPYHAFTSYIKSLRKSLGAIRLVLIFDEFEMLFYQGAQRSRIDTKNLLFYFRSMVQSGEFGIITAGITPLHELPSLGPGSPFFNIAVPRHVSFLDREAAIELIQRPTYGLLKYDPQVIEQLLTLSRRHPSLLQTLCFLVYNHCRKSDKLLVDLETVEIAIKQVYEQEYLLHHFMHQLNKTEQKIVKTAASLVEINKGTLTLDHLREVLSNKVKFQSSQLEKALNSLVKKEVLEVDNQGNYKFTIGIFQRWLVELESHPTL